MDVLSRINGKTNVMLNSNMQRSRTNARKKEIKFKKYVSTEL